MGSPIHRWSRVCLTICMIHVKEWERLLISVSQSKRIEVHGNISWARSAGRAWDTPRRLFQFTFVTLSWPDQCVNHHSNTFLDVALIGAFWKLVFLKNISWLETLPSASDPLSILCVGRSMYFWSFLRGMMDYIHRAWWHFKSWGVLRGNRKKQIDASETNVLQFKFWSISKFRMAIDVRNQNWSIQIEHFEIQRFVCSPPGGATCAFCALRLRAAKSESDFSRKNHGI